MELAIPEAKNGSGPTESSMTKQERHEETMESRVDYSHNLSHKAIVPVSILEHAQARFDYGNKLSRISAATDIP